MSRRYFLEAVMSDGSRCAAGLQEGYPSEDKALSIARAGIYAPDVEAVLVVQLLWTCRKGVDPDPEF